MDSYWTLHLRVQRTKKQQIKANLRKVLRRVPQGQPFAVTTRRKTESRITYYYIRLMMRSSRIHECNLLDVILNLSVFTEPTRHDPGRGRTRKWCFCHELWKLRNVLPFFHSFEPGTCRTIHYKLNFKERKFDNETFIAQSELIRLSGNSSYNWRPSIILHRCGWNKIQWIVHIKTRHGEINVSQFFMELDSQLGTP